MNEVQVRDALLALVPPVTSDDWADVLQRASGRHGHGRRFALVFAIALVVALAVGSALALSGRLGNLFRGTPVNDLTPRERFLMSELDMTGKAELIARKNGKAFYVIRRSDGRICYTIGEAREKLTPAQRDLRFRFGGGRCPAKHLFPSKALPVLDYSFYSFTRGDREARLAGLQGFAADVVDRIGVIGRDNHIIFTLPVHGNVYSAGKRGFMGGRGVVALDDHGKVLWAQCTALGGCGKYKTSPPPPPFTPAPQPSRPSEPRNPVRQAGADGGIRFTINGSHIRANFAQAAPQLRNKLVYKDGRIVLGCIKLVNVGGELNASGMYVTRPYATVVEISPWIPGSRTPVQYAPFDACTLSGNYGHQWGDANGTHDAVEIPLTARGRTYLAERAVARDLAWLTHARAFTPIRYGRQPFTSVTAAEHLQAHAIALPAPSATPPLGKLGIWIGPERRIVLAERAPTGRRFFVELRHGVIYRTNLLGLAKAF